MQDAWRRLAQAIEAGGAPDRGSVELKELIEQIAQLRSRLHDPADLALLDALADHFGTIVARRLCISLERDAHK